MTDQKIEELVRAVMADLGLVPGELSGGAPPAAAAREPAPPGATQAALGVTSPAFPPVAAQPSGELAISAPVVTLAEIGDRLDGVGRLVIQPGAVVTPAVRDELQRRKIALAYDRATSAKAPSGLRLVVFVHGSSAAPASLIPALQAEGIEVDVRTRECLIRGTDELGAELAGKAALGLIVSNFPAAALCLANRQRHLRAVWGIDPARLAADIASVGANLLVVDPARTGPFQWKQMVAQFCRLGPSECPAVLRERLA